MNNTKGNLPKTLFKKLIEDSQKLYFDSKLSFLRTHNGLRPANLHCLLGVTHAGKSTVTRTVVIDQIKNNPDIKVLVYLTEEGVDTFLKNLVISGELSDDELERIEVCSEQDGEAPKDFKELRDSISENNFSMVFFDNLTTSSTYATRSLRDQAERCNELKRIAQETNIAMFIIAHTEGSVTVNHQFLITEQNIRGLKYFPNLCEFFYILQTVQIGNNTHQFIRITKHRDQDCESNFHCLRYNKEKRIIAQSFASDFDAFKEVFNQRNKL